MPRNPGGVYSLPAGSIVTNGTTIDASQHNTPLNDIAADLNAVRPISSGGTGASSASDARTALGATTVGNAVFTAADEWVARWALGASPVGHDVFRAADAAEARTALGAAAVANLPPALTQGQVQNAGDTTQGTVSGQRLAQAFDARQQQLGVGQLWWNMTASRASGTLYQNTSGRPIAVSIRSGSTNVNTFLDVGQTPETMNTVSEYGSSPNHRISTCTAIVPNGNFYRHNGPFSVWMELR